MGREGGGGGWRKEGGQEDGRRKQPPLVWPHFQTLPLFLHVWGRCSWDRGVSPDTTPEKTADDQNTTTWSRSTESNWWWRRWWRGNLRDTWWRWGKVTESTARKTVSFLWSKVQKDPREFNLTLCCCSSGMLIVYLTNTAVVRVQEWIFNHVCALFC